MKARACWCGSTDHHEFSAEYVRCAICGTLISCVGLSDDELKVADDDSDFYGKKYWLEHQNQDLGFPSIFQRAKLDLTDRNLHWLKTLLRYKAPPSKVLELGCSHGSFVALLRQAGYDASGMEMSPWVVEFAQETFDIPMLVGPVENIELEAGTFDVVALMDVLEHLPDPVGTMSHAIRLLKPDGILLIQTPQAKDEMVYSALVETKAPFLEQFKSDEHLYLFTQSSATALFERLGASFVQFEPPIFHQYDMFFVVSRQPIQMIPEADAEKSIETPKGRFVQALLDQDKRIKSLDEHVKIIDADRAARLEQIHTLTAMVHDLQAKENNTQR
ncbi:class I SAM-dependent methyltransferase [Rhizobium sp. S153]|uniref:Class I SAM-dependent methyltransferase n=1 Tax=Ciceribacter sichuanensis TaxID=2949647 RepID=A0ABT0V3G1_9HYPH|nr:class I SAM-dependent methyltransferase [Ciceribacter sp. S153]MCM2400148.1 class I SAM-dependent methyltransferase [Ciceribacter sp. S153]